MLALLLSGCSIMRPMLCSSPPQYLMQPLPPLPLYEPDRPDGSLSLPGFYQACGNDVLLLKECRAMINQFQEWWN